MIEWKMQSNGRKQMNNITAYIILILAVVLGTWMVIDGWEVYKMQYWLHVKLALVVPLLAYHFYCGHLLQIFKQDKNT